MLTRTNFATHATEFSSIVTDGAFSDKNGNPLSRDEGIDGLINLFTNTRTSGGTLYIVGNGGSAAVASHAVTDFFNVGGLRAMSLHDSSTLTCFSNDYGYEHAFSRRVERLITKHDVLIAISSSGQSANILNACESAINKAASVITLSGFNADNPLRELGDYNYWLNTDDYGMAEIGHLFLLHYLSDLLGLGWSKENND
jgi:D-sedoheptulose 7-phosphate isomerase